MKQVRLSNPRKIYHMNFETAQRIYDNLLPEDIFPDNEEIQRQKNWRKEYEEEYRQWHEENFFD